MKFTYRSGHRPLEGITLKYGIGLGGFGEVYFAQTDSGKDLALKLICKNVEVELRGIRECLNLKHPNLVDIHDVKVDAEGNHWVLMEFVKGETLRDILKRHAKGITPEQAQRWFLGIAAALSYLHDQGIVHRDMKPGNVFVENDIVKLGDYGLCKLISGSIQEAHTQSVGTLHYMAPETTSGSYGKQVDIYAAGVLLYEMLTGEVPFDGQSPGELIFKHQSQPADLTRVPTEFRAIVNRALAKNPAQRYRTMAEFARDVQGIGTEPIARVQAAPTTTPPIPVQPVPTLPQVNRLRDLCVGLLGSTALVGVLSILAGMIFRLNDVREFGQFFFLTLACVWAVLIPCQLWSGKVGESLPRRLILLSLGLGVGVLAFWLEGRHLPALLATSANAAEKQPALEAVSNRDAPLQQVYRRMFRGNSDLPLVASYLTFFGLAFFGLRWWKLTERRRTTRLDFMHVLAAGVLGFLLHLLVPGPGETQALAALVLTAAVVQVVSPWEENRGGKKKRLRLPGV